MGFVFAKDNDVFIVGMGRDINFLGVLPIFKFFVVFEGSDKEDGWGFED